jgi:hypothetical protein
MGRPGLSAADVVRAYVALLRQRRHPGPTNIRLELGKGSFSTIAKYIDRLAFVRPPRRR